MKIQQWLFELLRKQSVTDGRTHGRTDERTDARTDNVKTVYPLQTQFAGGIINEIQVADYNFWLVYFNHTCSWSRTRGCTQVRWTLWSTSSIDPFTKPRARAFITNISTCIKDIKYIYPKRQEELQGMTYHITSIARTLTACSSWLIWSWLIWSIWYICLWHQTKAKQFLLILVSINPLYSDGFSQTYWYNKYGIAHFVFQWDIGKKFLNYDVFLSQKVILILANSTDPEEMQHYAVFHLGLCCLLKFPLRGFQNTKG